MSDWEIIGHVPGTRDITVRDASGTFNYNVEQAINHAKGVRPAQKTLDPVDHQHAPIPRAAVYYEFKKGDFLPTHEHDQATLHDVRVAYGRVLVEKPSGNVILGAGDVCSLAPGEPHRVEALEDAATTHALVIAPRSRRT